MATVDINGNLVDFPDDLTPEQLSQAVASAAQQMGGQQPQKGLMGRAWDALAIPEQKSREGLQMLASMVPNPEPTGNMPLDLARGAPRIAADTLAEFAPSFVSRGSIATAGVGKLAGLAAPAAKAMLRGIGKQGESLSGSAPGSLEAAYKDSTLMFGKGRKAASETYEAAKAGEKIHYGDKLSSAKKFFDQSYAKAKAGTLGSVEALEARKVADDLYDSGQYVGDEILSKRKVFDEVAKKAFAGADSQFKRAIQSESLRNLLPQNKYGGTSAFKIAIMTALKKMGPLGTAASTALSPIAQGAAATGAGATARQVLAPMAANANVAASVNAVISEALKRRRSNARQ